MATESAAISALASIPSSLTATTYSRRAEISVPPKLFLLHPNIQIPHPCPFQHPPKRRLCPCRPRHGHPLRPSARAPALGPTRNALAVATATRATKNAAASVAACAHATAVDPRLPPSLHPRLRLLQVHRRRVLAAETRLLALRMPIVAQGTVAGAPAKAAELKVDFPGVRSVVTSEARTALLTIKNL